MKKLSMALAVSSIALVAPGLAAADTFNYVSVKGGWAQVRDNHFDKADDALRDEEPREDYGARIDTSYDDGFMGALALGRQYDQGRNFNVRAEVEVGYQAADVDRHTQTVTETETNPNVPRTDSVARPDDPEGDFTTLYAFASVYGERDLRVIPNASFIFGAGAGMGQIEFDDYGVEGLVLMDDSDISPGYHLTTGWAYHVDERISLEATYRYMAFEDVGMEAEDGTSTRQRIDSHNFMAGVRVGF